MTTTTNRAPSFDIREHLDKLTPAKGKNRYVCPVCGGNDLTVDPKNGAYKCWNSDCECKDIREAVSPWDKVKGNNKSDHICQDHKPKPPTPALIPENSIELAKLPEYVTHPEKRKRGHQTEIEYPYSDTQWVLRVERPSHESPKGYEKATYPYHLNETGEQTKGKGDAAWNPYRIDEVETYGAGKWILGVEGEPCTEAARYLSLVGFTMQGAGWTDGDLTRAMLQCKSASVAGVAYLPDHDKTGYEKAEKMAHAAAKAQLPFLMLDPTLLWSECSHGQDIADWVKWGMEKGWDKEEFVRRLEDQFNAAAERERLRQDIENDDWDDTSDGDGGDRSEEGFTEHNFWNAPVSWRGEIGWLFEKEVPVTEKDEVGNETPVIGEDGQPVTEKVSTFVPKANFDFVVERELESEEGGGVVLLVKRSLDRSQKRVIISSQDYGSAKDFEAALKRVYKSGVVCNLKSEHLKSLIHVKLREYRARGGITYRLQDRAGQQADGHWVFKDCQITKDGVWSAEPNSDWIFNENLGGEDKMPQPSVVPPNPNALERLVAAMRKFHGAEGIYPAMMALGFGGASVHYRTIMKIERRFPQVNFIGDPGLNKSICAANALALVGWLNGDGQISGVSESKLYECLKLTGSLPLCLDDPQKSRELDEILKRLYNAVPRMVRGNYQEPHAPLMVTSNHAIGDQQLATLTRMLQIPVYRQTDGDPSAWDEMQEAMEGASGCLPDLIKLGYPKAEIKQLEGELRSHLPKSHPRIASSMALILWYAMAVAKLADFDAESIKQYAITQLCPIANAADTNSDSITDFLDKLSALKSEALVGDWNCQVVETKTGKALAIQMSQVFPLIDRQFNPVYSRKVLEALIAKSGGTLQSVQKFHSNRDESLAYYRAKLTAETEPKEPEYKPKRCVLVPFHLIKGFTDDWKSPTPPDDPMGEPVTSPVTSVTPSYTQLHEKCNQQNVDPEVDSAIIDSLVTSFSEKSTKQNQQQVEEAVTDVLGQEQNSHTLVLEKDVTEENLEAVALIPAESERLHISCNQTVTGCNQREKNVTELVEKKVDTITTTPDVQPEVIAPTPAHVDTAEGENPVPPVENAPEATEVGTDEQTPQTTMQKPAQTGIEVVESAQFRVGDRVNIQAGGKFDGKSATVFDCSNLDEIGVTLDQAEGGYELCFPAKYLINIGEEF